MKQLLSLLLFIPGLIFSQEMNPSQSELSFLVGEWEVERTYSPNERPRKLKGILTCEWTLDSTYVACVYEIERPQKKRSFDHVFFNYNPIYGKYESMWLSSTWPIKVIMQGEQVDHSFIYEAEFPIQDGIIEYVKSDWTLQLNQVKPSFSRKTLIRTSQDEANEWFHHMNEVATLISKPNP